MKKPKFSLLILVMPITVLFVLSCSKEGGNGGTPTEPEPSDFAVFVNGEFGTGIGYHWSS